MIIHKIENKEEQIDSFDKLIEYITDGEKTNGSIHYENIISTDSPEAAVAEMRATAATNLRADHSIEHFVVSFKSDEYPDEKEVFKGVKHIVKRMGYEGHQAVFAVHKDTDNIHIHVAINRIHPMTSKPHTPDYVLDTIHYAAREVEIANNWHHDNGNYEIQIDKEGERHIVKNYENSKTRVRIEVVDDKFVYVPEKERDEDSIGDKKTLSNGAEQMEIRSGRQSFESFAKENLKELHNAQSWEDAHRIAGEYGVVLELNSKCNGLVMLDINNRDNSCSGSAAGRQLSLGKMEGKFDHSFVPAGVDYASESDPLKHYNPDAFATRFKSEEVKEAEVKNLNGERLSDNDVKHLERQKAEGALYSTYKREKELYYQATKDQKQIAMAAQKEKEAERWSQFIEESKEARRSALSGLKAGPEKDKAEMRLAREKAIKTAELDALREAERDAIKKEFGTGKFPDYRDWVDERGKTNLDARQVSDLIQNQAKSGNNIGVEYQNIDKSFVFKAENINAKGVAAMNLKELVADVRVNEITKTVNTHYKRSDREVFVDKGLKFNITSREDADLTSAMLIANQKAYGKGISIVSGTSEFKDKVRELAAKHNIKILSDDSETEADMGRSLNKTTQATKEGYEHENTAETESAVSRPTTPSKSEPKTEKSSSSSWELGKGFVEDKDKTGKSTDLSKEGKDEPKSENEMQEMMRKAKSKSETETGAR